MGKGTKSGRALVLQLQSECASSRHESVLREFLRSLYSDQPSAVGVPKYEVMYFVEVTGEPDFFLWQFVLWLAQFVPTGHTPEN